jgi:hypothetical protein
MITKFINYGGLILMAITGILGIYWGSYQGNYARGCYWLLLLLIIAKGLDWHSERKIRISW